MQEKLQEKQKFLPVLTGGGRCEGLEKWSCLVGPGLLSPPSCWIPIQPMSLLVTAQLSCP